MMHPRGRRVDEVSVPSPRPGSPPGTLQ